MAGKKEWKIEKFLESVSKFQMCKCHSNLIHLQAFFKETHRYSLNLDK